MRTRKTNEYVHVKLINNCVKLILTEPANYLMRTC